MTTTKKRLVQRAVAAYLRYDPGGETPSFLASTVEVYDDVTYVMLRSGARIVAVYRVDDTVEPFQLRRLLRYRPGPYGRQPLSV